MKNLLIIEDEENIARAQELILSEHFNVTIAKDGAEGLAKAKELTGKDIEVESIVDDTIIGGFILRIGDIQYNASISNQLSKLKREFTLN